jgi:hypothetical protein
MLVYPHEILQNHFPQRRGSEDAEYVVRLSQATSPRSGFVQRLNPALNLAPFGRWTLRDKAAQRRLALLQGLPQIRKCA